MSLDMFPDSFIDYMLEQTDKEKAMETCLNCGKKIEVSIFKNTGHCSENCRKVLMGETNEVRAQTDAGVTAMLRQPEGIDRRSIT